MEKLIFDSIPETIQDLGTGHSLVHLNVQEEADNQFSALVVRVEHPVTRDKVIAAFIRAEFSDNAREAALRKGIADKTNPDLGLTTFKFTNGRADGDTTKITDKTMPDMDIPLMRKAEAYLTYAEAVLRGGSNVGGLTALASVNELRKRAKATQFSSVSLDDVLDEWAREFYFEGRRRTDLIRYGYFGGNGGYNWDWKGGTLAGTIFSKNYNLYPIPQTDMSANSNLTQNSGY